MRETYLSRTNRTSPFTEALLYLAVVKEGYAGVGEAHGPLSSGSNARQPLSGTRVRLVGLIFTRLSWKTTGIRKAQEAEEPTART